MEPHPVGNRHRLAIIAGGGQLPLYVARAARHEGEIPLIITVRGEDLADFSGFDVFDASIGDFKSISRELVEASIGRVVLSGAVRRRPEIRDIRPTFASLKLFPRVIKTLMSGGDNAVLIMVISILEEIGCQVVGAHEIAPDLLALEGSFGKVDPSHDDWRDIDAGCQAAKLLGQLDIGQGAISLGGRVVALEGAEGTDLMLQRVTQIKALGRVSARRRGVLVKLCKPGQDLRADLPSIGLSTLKFAHEAGLAGIAVEAGRSLVLERAQLLEKLDGQDMFIYGLPPGAEGSMR